MEFRLLTNFWEFAVLAAIGLLILGLSVAAFVLGGLRHFVLARDIEPTREWFESFDFSRYQALIQLFAPQDFEFLKSQPGYMPQLLARLRADRLAIAESYLNELQGDVRLLLNFANQASAGAGMDAGDFSAFLLKQELRFAVNIARLRCELALMKIGLRRQIEFENLLATVRPLVQCSRNLALQSV
jgi:hypothetical protein